MQSDMLLCQGENAWYPMVAFVGDGDARIHLTADPHYQLTGALRRSFFLRSAVASLGLAVAFLPSAYLDVNDTLVALLGVAGLVLVFLSGALLPRLIGHLEVPRERLALTIARHVGPGPLTTDEVESIAFQITNRGTASVIVRSCGFATRGGDVDALTVDDKQIAGRVTEGSSVRLLARAAAFSQVDRGTAAGPPKWGFARSASGQTFRGRLPNEVRDLLWGNADYRPRHKPWENDRWPI